jgi:hypothetical protein
VIDVRDDAKIARVLDSHGSAELCGCVLKRSIYARGVTAPKAVGRDYRAGGRIVRRFCAGAKLATDTVAVQ